LVFRDLLLNRDAPVQIPPATAPTGPLSAQLPYWANLLSPQRWLLAGFAVLSLLALAITIWSPDLPR
jgi:hypothetical protein